MVGRPILERRIEMDTEMIKELAESVNNVALSAVKPYQDHIARLLIKNRILEDGMQEIARQGRDCEDDYESLFGCVIAIADKTLQNI